MRVLGSRRVGKLKKLLVLGSVALLFALSPSAEATEKDRLIVARAKIAKGQKLMSQAEYVAAEKQFRRAIALEPKLPTAHLGLGQALVGQQRYQEALPALAEAERCFVEGEQAVQIADMRKRQIAERQTLSLQDINAAINDRSGIAGTVPPRSFGSALLNPNKIQTEQFVFRERWELEDVEAVSDQVFYLKGISYLRTGQRSRGIEALEICLLLNEKHQLAHYNLSVARFTGGELDQAKAHLEAAIARGLEPNARFVADLDRALSARQQAPD